LVEQHDVIGQVHMAVVVDPLRQDLAAGVLVRGRKAHAAEFSSVLARPRPRQASTRNWCMQVAARNAVMPPTSCGGLTVLISKATKFSPASDCSSASPSPAEAPPQVGVHTPGAQDGSKKSMSKHR